MPTAVTWTTRGVDRGAIVPLEPTLTVALALPPCRFREIADSVGAILMADVAHIAGLVAKGESPSPFEVRAPLPPYTRLASARYT